MSDIRAILFDYFGVLANRYGQLDHTLIQFIRAHLADRFTLAVLSNTNAGTAREMCGSDAGLFHAVMLSGQLGVAKPDERVFRLAAARLSEFPESCLLIDDSARNCAGAQNVGMQAILYTNVDELAQKLADYAIITP